MRLLGVCCLVAACGSDPGLLLVVKSGSTAATTVEVFLPDGVNDGSIGMPPQGSTPVRGAVFSVIDSVKATMTGEADILLQPGDLQDVPGLLVLAYDGNGTPVAETIVRNADGSPIHLPSSTASELEITLEPATYVPPTGLAAASDTARIARWSSTGPDGDLAGGCIAVMGGDGTSFFDTKDDLDCDGQQPECDDTVFDDVDMPATAVPVSACASRDFTTPPTKRACRLGQTIACTDGIGTCGPLHSGIPPICAPTALCKACPNSNSTSGTSGLDPSCELDALMNGDDVPLIDCDVPALGSNGSITPCTDSGVTFDFSMHAGAGWDCAPTVGFIDTFGGLGPQTNVGPLSFGGMGTVGAYTVTAACSTGAVASIDFQMGSVSGQVVPIDANTSAQGLLVFGTRPGNVTAPFAELAVPFHLHFHVVTSCSLTEITKCQLMTLHSGDGAGDPMWAGCAGAP